MSDEDGLVEACGEEDDDAEVDERNKLCMIIFANEKKSDERPEGCARKPVFEDEYFAEVLLYVEVEDEDVEDEDEDEDKVRRILGFGIDIDIDFDDFDFGMAELEIWFASR